MGVFGDLFDFNGDGETDFFEDMLGSGWLAQLPEDEVEDE